MAKPKALRDAIEEARAALGSAQDVERLRAKLGELPASASGSSQQPAAPKLASAATKVALGTVATLLLIGGTFVLLQRASSKPAIVAPRPTPAPIEVPVAAAPAPAPVVAPVPIEAVEPKRAQTKLTTPRRKLAATAAPQPQPEAAPVTAPKELELLTEAQDAIDAAPQRALSLLEDHARFYPSGNFALERESLAIEALRKLGRISAAQERARSFIARFPNASNAKHLQRWLDESAGVDHNNQAPPLPKP